MGGEGKRNAGRIGEATIPGTRYSTVPGFSTLAHTTKYLVVHTSKNNVIEQEDKRAGRGWYCCFAWHCHCYATRYTDVDDSYNQLVQKNKKVVRVLQFSSGIPGIFHPGILGTGDDSIISARGALEPSRASHFFETMVDAHCTRRRGFHPTLVGCCVSFG